MAGASGYGVAAATLTSKRCEDSGENEELGHAWERNTVWGGLLLCPFLGWVLLCPFLGINSF